MTTKKTDVSDAEALLTPREVANLFRVDPKTVARWATSGKLGAIWTPGGHRRFREAEVNRFFREVQRASTDLHAEEFVPPEGVEQGTLW